MPTVPRMDGDKQFTIRRGLSAPGLGNGPDTPGPESFLKGRETTKALAVAGETLSKVGEILQKKADQDTAFKIRESATQYERALRDDVITTQQTETGEKAEGLTERKGNQYAIMRNDFGKKFEGDEAAQNAWAITALNIESNTLDHIARIELSEREKRKEAWAKNETANVVEAASTSYSDGVPIEDLFNKFADDYNKTFPNQDNSGFLKKVHEDVIMSRLKTLAITNPNAYKIERQEYAESGKYDYLSIDAGDLYSLDRVAEKQEGDQIEATVYKDLKSEFKSPLQILNYMDNHFDELEGKYGNKYNKVHDEVRRRVAVEQRTIEHNKNEADKQRHDGATLSLMDAIHTKNPDTIYNTARSLLKSGSISDETALRMTLLSESIGKKEDAAETIKISHAALSEYMDMLKNGVYPDEHDIVSDPRLTERDKNSFFQRLRTLNAIGSVGISGYGVPKKSKVNLFDAMHGTSPSGKTPQAKSQPKVKIQNIQTATNPKTGEKIQLVDGKWVPMKNK